MAIAIAIPVIALAVVAAFGVMQTRQISSNLITSLLKEVNKSNALILNADRDFYQAMQAYLQMQSTTNPKTLKAKAESFKENSKQTIDRVSAAVKALENSNAINLPHPDAKVKIPKLYKDFQTNFKVWNSLFDPMKNTMKDDALFWKSFNNARDSINYITEIIEEYAKISVQTSEQMVRETTYTLIGIGVIALILSIVVGLSLASSISNIISNSMQELSVSAGEVSSISTQVADGSRKFAEASTEQASSVEEVSATLEETAAMVQSNSDDSKRAFSLSHKVNTAITNGSEQMNEMMQSMNLINESSREITKVLKGIEAIAFQTNILSLNAAVEAARAGDAGKGFAVVADEVRTLAHKSAQEAQSISQILAKNVELSNSATEVVDRACTSFDEIQKEVNEISQLIDGLAKAGEEQRIGISQISETMQHMEQVVQNIASEASSNMEMAANLLQPVEKMQTLAKRLSIKEGSDKES